MRLHVKCPRELRSVQAALANDVSAIHALLLGDLLGALPVTRALGVAATQRC